ISNMGMWKHSMSLVDSNLTLAQRCIWYLSFSLFADLPFVSPDSPRDVLDARTDQHAIKRYIKEHCFLDYAARQWTNHYRNARAKNDTLSDLAIDICDTRSKRYFIWSSVCSKLSIAEELTGLTVAPRLGLDGLTEQPSQTEADFAAEDQECYTAM